MKKVFLIIALTTVFKASAAQTGVPDTLSYLNSIVNNKAAYIGQPFSTLLNFLQIQIKFFSPYDGDIHNKNNETSTAFGWYSVQNPQDVALTYPLLEIYWQPCLDIRQSRALYSQGWSSTLASHYSTRIVSDIKVRE